MDESNIIIKAEIVDTDYDENRKHEELIGPINGVMIKSEPLESDIITKSEAHEIGTITTELNSDLVLMIINVTIANSCFKDLHTKLLTHKKLPGSYAVIITRNNFNYFPIIPTLNKTSENYNNTANLIDLEKSELERSELNVVENPFRIVISGTTLKASFQAFGKEKFSVPNVIEWNVTAWKVSEEFLPLLGYLSRHGDTGVYRVCEGILDDDIRSNNNVAVTSLSLVTITTPFPRRESPNCSIVQPAQFKNKCLSCTKWLSNLRGYRKRKSATMKDKELSDTDVSSTTMLRALSPERLKERLSNIINERKCLRRRVKSLEDQLKKLEKKVEMKQANKKKIKK